jgi:alpha-glucosidase
MSNGMHGLKPLDSFERSGQTVNFRFGKALLAVSVLTGGLLRVRYAYDGKLLARRSWAVTPEDQAFSPVDFQVSGEPTQVVIITAQVRLHVRRQDGGIEFLDAAGNMLAQDSAEAGPEFAPGGGAACLKQMPPDEHYYGFGERTSLLDKRGRRYTCWNVDPVDRHEDHGPGTDMLYQAIPFYMALRPQAGGYGLFLNNTYRTAFDMGQTSRQLIVISADGGELDYYLIYGPEPQKIVETYTELTGRMSLPPRWALGYQQCRWSYYPEAQVREVAAGLRANRLPADVIHLDIDYMRGYRVFTWDKQHFPDPPKLIADLAGDGFQVVTILDPGVKYDPDSDYEVYDQGEANDYFVRKSDGEVFHGYVWPDDSVFPDFVRPEVREWWGGLHKELLEAGVKGIWNDMNEPAISDRPFRENSLKIDFPPDTPLGPPEELVTSAEMHNMYGYLEDLATYQGLRKLQPTTRPFLLTRAGYAGIQKWAAVWTGDNSAFWEHLEMAMPQLANLGLSGVSFTGTDIGGFGGAGSGELWARWIQLGAFYPFARGHSAQGTAPKEPWTFGAEITVIVRKYLELRYRLLPYLYTLFEESTHTGVPLLRPLLYHFWQDPATLELHDQLMLGEGLLLAPVYRPGQEYRQVYLPSATWYDFWTGKPVTERYLLAHAPLDYLPLYGRGGSIIPFGPVMQHTGERPLDDLTLQVYLDEQGQATGRLYEDDGISFAYQQGASCLTTFQAVSDGAGQVAVRASREGDFQPPSRPVNLKVFGPGGLKEAHLDEDKASWEIKL